MPSVGLFQIYIGVIELRLWPLVFIPSPGQGRICKLTPAEMPVKCNAMQMNYLCAKKDGVAKGKRVTVMPRSLIARFTMKNSAGFNMDLFR